MNYFLQHYGILGMKWGVRRTPEELGRILGAKKIVSSKMKTNTDGSVTFKKGFNFNRIDGNSLRINKSGALYASYGVDDAARYVKSLGPTKMGKLLGTGGTTIHHLSVSSKMKMASEKDVAKSICSALLNDEGLLSSFNDSIYSTTAHASSNDAFDDLTVDELKKALNNTSSKSAKRIAYSVSTMLGNEAYAEESRKVYDTIRKDGFDAIPDLADRFTGTSESAVIIINPNKIKSESSTYITKDVMKAGKEYVKTLKKLKASEILND